MNEFNMAPGGHKDVSKKKDNNPNLEYYNELHKKLDQELAREKQLDDRFTKFFDLRDLVNEKYNKALTEFNNVLDDENVSDEKFLELSKKEEELNQKLSKISNIINKILEAIKTNDSQQTFVKISEIEDQLREE